MKKITFSACFLLFTLFSFSQGKADYRELFNQGNLLIMEENYSMALKYFLDAYKIDSSNANINYKVGYCYLQSGTEKNKALYYLSKATQNVGHNYVDMEPREKKAPEMAYYYLGLAYRLEYKFNESNLYMNKFKDIVGNKNKELVKDIDRQIETNFNAIELTKDTAQVTIVNMGDSINSVYPDYSPTITADESIIIFTSRRPGSTGGDKSEADQFYEDIYYSIKKRDGTWSSPKSISENINTVGSEANIGLSPDGQRLFLYKDNNGGDIYYSDLEGDRWNFPIALNSNINTKYWETHATVSSDGNTLYFVSDKPGGLGGRDIYRCVKLPNGQWSLPLNLGPTINTPYDEDAPFIHPDGVTMYFSSKGHKNIGGFDIFKTVKDDEGKWSTPENLKAPINTPDDDIFYVQSADGKRGYFSSFRKGGYGEKDIYIINYETSQTEALTLLKGYLTFDGNTDKIPSDVHIIVTDMETGLVVQDVKPNAVTGKYILILTPGKEGKTYVISYEAEGFQPVSETIEIPASSSYQEIEKELLLRAINFESKTLGTISLSGTIKNEKGEHIPGAAIVIKDNVTGKLLETYYTTSDSGSFYFVLNRGQNYNISFEAMGYLFQSENVNVPKQPEYSALKREIVLEKVHAGAKITLNNIFFDSNKATLRKESTIEIDKLVKLMKDFPQLKIEVGGHTDSQGNDAANLKLSQMRSQAVVDVLIKKGVDKKRLIAKGYGETMPVAPNNLPNGKPDLKGMQKNRRVELKILE